jgi:hypothetical protein
MLATVCVPLASCSGDSANTMTVTQGASSTQGGLSGTITTTLSKQDKLHVFLAQVKPLRETLNQQVTTARKALKAYQANPTSTTAQTSGDTRR